MSSLILNSRRALLNTSRTTTALRSHSNEASKSCVVGISAGLLAAAAVAMSPEITALIPLAVEVILIAFRVGRHVRRTARHVENANTNEDPESWSYAIAGMTEAEGQTMLTSFNQEKVRSCPWLPRMSQIDTFQQAFPHCNHPYISAFTADSVTISGPSATLKQLWESSAASTSKRVPLPIYGPYHAPHLHRDVDINGILCSSDPRRSRTLANYRLALPLISTSSGNCFDMSSDALTVLAAVINDVLSEPLKLQDVVAGCRDIVAASHCNKCNIISLGPNDSESMFTKALDSETDAEVLFHINTPAEIPGGLGAMDDASRTSRKPKLAIVGMAGRFPNAADHEKFWDLLEAGLDVHRKVRLLSLCTLSQLILTISKIPKDRFDVDKHFDPTGKTRNTSHTPYGCFIDQPGLFDPRFFNMSPREATQTDPMHRLGLASAYEALEMAGYVPNRSPSTQLERIGTFYGQTSDDWREINEAQDIDTYFITAGVRAFAPVSCGSGNT